MERYELVRLLGEGATGDVHLARDRLLDRREVALKRLRVRFDDTLRDALEREFATMAALAVPGVARVFDFGVLPPRDGEPQRSFFTRSYVEGLSLDAAARDTSVEEKVRLLARVADVIGPLHRIGVVHGDIKPGNAIIDARGAAHVIDFGLARVVGRDHATEHPSGTLPFMAPELLAGKPATPRSDIYALGVTLWLLLTGEYPHRRMRWSDTSRKEPPPGVPPGVDPVTQKALAVALRACADDPLDRFPTVEELVAGLERCFPALASTRAAAPFVPPRPRGHASLVERLQAELRDRASSGGAVVVVGARGGGKTRLLEELKWRLQIRAIPVLEVAFRAADGAAPVRSLLRQASVAVEGVEPAAALDRVLGRLDAGVLDVGGISDALALALPALGGEGPVVVLADDLDEASDAGAQVLRALRFAEARRPLVVFATATRADAPAVQSLDASRTESLPLLADDDARALAGEALGALDASTLDALVAHARGLPGALVEALAALAGADAPAVSDVERLPPYEAGVALANARLSAVAAPVRRLLAAVALLGHALGREALAALASCTGVERDDLADALLAGERAGLLVARPEGLALADSGVAKALTVALGEGGSTALARELLVPESQAKLAAADVARLAVLAGDAPLVRRHVPAVAAALATSGSHAAAAAFFEGLLEWSDGEERRAATLGLARSRHALGDHASSAALAGTVLADAAASPAERTEAAVVQARALTALGRFDAAVEALALVPPDAEPRARASAYRELAKVHLRRGDYDALEAAARAGLACAPDNDAVRVDLLCSMGMSASYRSEHERAQEHHEQALALARRLGARREEADALAYLAIGRWRRGDALGARDLFAQCLALARERGDLGTMATFSMNLGATLFHLGEPGQAAEHYASAMRLARRAGRASTYAQARNNLALVHVYFGSYERARVEIDEVLTDARAAGQRYIEAQAIAVLGDLAARGGRGDEALARYDEAIACYAELGQTREIADHSLDAAEALLDRGELGDAAAATERIARARAIVDREGLEDLRGRLALFEARAWAADGDAERARPVLETLVEQARSRGQRDLHWSALAALARVHEALGAPFVATRHDRLAVEVLEDIALRVPRADREAFWQDPRRRAARARAARIDSLGGRSASRGPSTLLGDPRLERLLEIIKRLAGERDLDRLLERITESAVDLSGAENGYVLLVEADGQLAARTQRVAGARGPDPHETFSRSIAEAVLIDGEPIVTVDATDDGRLSEYMSVHKMMLRSVACLPIRSPDGPVGVLYLEHRRAPGRFDDATVELLHAFADQAAIALENARLTRENERRRRELEEANQALERAKDDLELSLSARSGELVQVHRELARAPAAPRSEARHGMVGTSAAMQRVYECIDRLHDVSVPVALWGESGTGKELAARAIHRWGPRARGPFVAVSCGGVPETLLESELFGHVKGAFSGADREKVGVLARASGGTLLLDDVDAMPPRMQVDLLRVLQEGRICKVGGEVEEPIDVRFIAASHASLADLVAAGRFREDLYYRLDVVEIRLPPLRERPEDIALLCTHFLRAFAARDGRPEKRLSRAALDALRAQRWPGNVRQLEHVLVQASVLADGAVLEPADLALDGTGTSVTPPRAPAPAPDLVTAPQSAEAFRADEKRRILSALEAHQWNRARAARALGMARRTFYRRLQEYEILGGTE